MNLTASLSLQVLCQLIGSRAPYSNDANIVISNLPAISNQLPPPVQPATLPDGYIAYPEIGAAYKIVFDEVTWSEARERCNLEGAYLPSLDSKRKMEYVWNATYYTYHRTDNFVNFHVGVYYMDKKWVSVSTGKTLSNLPWSESFPAELHDNCATVEVVQDGESLLWNSVDCSYTRFYLCEVPIPKDYGTQEFQSAQLSVN